jgi:hypothetical protein
MRCRDLTMAMLDGAVKTQLHEVTHEIRRTPSAAYDLAASSAGANLVQESVLRTAGLTPRLNAVNESA